MKYQGNTIDGWMSKEELDFLFDNAQKYSNIVEIGSFKGRSTLALLSGTKGKVIAIDNWQLSLDTRSPEHGELVYRIFLENTSGYKNLEILRMTSNEGVKKFKDQSIDMVFMDFNTNYADYLEAIKLWLPKTKKLICGHEYSKRWPDVIKAVDEVFGKPDGVIGMIWYKFL